MKIGILTMEIHESRQPDSVGSSRIRGTWIKDNWPQAELFHMGRKYDAIIFQKSYFIRYAKEYEGIKILDMCDPDWLESKPIIEMIEHCDGVTTSTESLAEYVRKITDKPVMCIPDRIDFSTIDQRKKHSGVARSVVWFGYSANARQLDQVLGSLKRLGLSLVVISDRSYYPQAKVQGVDDQWIQENIKNVKYDYEISNSDIIQYGDIVLNPRLNEPRFKYKSDNKTSLAWALGMPVAKDSEDLEKYMSEDDRKKEIIRVDKFLRDEYDISKSVSQYQEFIIQLKNGRKGK